MFHDINQLKILMFIYRDEGSYIFQFWLNFYFFEAAGDTKLLKVKVGEITNVKGRAWKRSTKVDR